MKSLQRAFLTVSLSLAASLLGCGGDDPDGARAASACGHSPAQLMGGWRAAGGSARACFAAGGQMWIGDSESEITGRSSCTTSSDACGFDCLDPDGGSPFSGTLLVTSDQLQLEVTDCPASSESCRGSYTRDPTVRCQ